jgi:hypothetical protein
VSHRKSSRITRCSHAFRSSFVTLTDPEAQRAITHPGGLPHHISHTAVTVKIFDVMCMEPSICSLVLEQVLWTVSMLRVYGSLSVLLCRARSSVRLIGLLHQRSPPHAHILYCSFNHCIRLIFSGSPSYAHMPNQSSIHCLKLTRSGRLPQALMYETKLYLHIDLMNSRRPSHAHMYGTKLYFYIDLIYS